MWREFCGSLAAAAESGFIFTLDQSAWKKTGSSLITFAGQGGCGPDSDFPLWSSVLQCHTGLEGKSWDTGLCFLLLRVTESRGEGTGKPAELPQWRWQCGGWDDSTGNASACVSPWDYSCFVCAKKFLVIEAVSNKIHVP